jgi:hypothetical protein
MGQILGSYKGKFAVIGGAVPWLLLENDDMAHVGTLDVDIALDAEALKEGDEYKTLIESLTSNGYQQRKDLKRFQLVRQVDAKDGNPPIDVIVDFLMPKDAKLEKTIQRRHKQKDAYDIYYCVRNYPGGSAALAQNCKSVQEQPGGKEGYGYIAEKFAKDDGYGPTSIRKFVEDSDILETRTPKQWQQDAFGQVQAWLKAMGLA